MATPNWTGATANNPLLASQVNQLLGTHAFTVVYKGVERDNQSTAGTGATNSNSTWIAQKFTAGTTYTSGRVVLTLAVTGSPGPWTVTLRPDNAGAPSATILATVNLPNSFVPGSAGAVSMPLSASLTSTTVYWIVAQAVGDVSNFYAWSKSDQASGTSTSTNGTTWTTQAYGSLFQVWDNSTTHANSPLAHTFEDSGARWTSFGQTASRQLVTLNEYTTAQGGSYVQSAATLGYTNGLVTSTSQGAAVNTVAPWTARHSGLIGSADAMTATNDVNQFLGTHPGSPIYQGNAILHPDGSGGFLSGRLTNTYDLDQPFTMVGSTIGRVQVPFIATGNGSDMVVSLCNDNSGNPGTVITRTRIPASWLNQISAVKATSIGVTAGLPDFSKQQAPFLTNNPLALAQFNRNYMASFITVNWPYPTSGNLGPSTTPTSCFYNGYFIQMGGNVGSTYLTNTFTIGFDTLGNLAQAVPQPALPQGTDGSAGCAVAVDPVSGAATVVIAGGSTSVGVLTNAVYTAGFNTQTGTLSAWSAQATLPGTNQFFGMASYNGYVYTVGGANGGVSGNTVLFARVQNGQITAWNTTTPIPGPGQALSLVAANNGFLFVIGGSTGVGLTTTYYAPINSDGTLGSWQNGPTLPVAISTAAFNAGIAANDAVIVNGNSNLLSLGVTPDGPDVAWQQQSFGSGGNFFAAINAGAGLIRYYGLYATTYTTMLVTLYGCVSVPLPTTGLTNGTTYHVLIQSPNADLNNFFAVPYDQGPVFPGTPKFRWSVKNSGTWTASGTGAIPVFIYDNSNSNELANGATGNNLVWHTWEDSGARISTLARATTPDQRLLGVMEATVIPTQLNSNAGFETTLSPWGIGATGTLVRSQTHVYEGSWAAQVTPNGTSANVFFQSEHVNCVPGQKFTVSMWVYAVNTITSNFSATLFWYNSSATFLSESDNLVTIPAGTWTFVSNTFTAPANAFSLTINPRQSGTPPVGNVFYIDQAMVYDPVSGPQLSTVAQVGYQGTWPGSGLWPPTGTTQLA